MSTNNFSFENILVVVPDFTYRRQCEQCEIDALDCEHLTGESDFDNFGYDMYVEDVQGQLQKIGFDICDRADSDRNYAGRIIAKWGLEDNDGMIKWLEVVIKNGYYSGANIDWTADGDFGIVSEQNKKQVAHYEAMNRKFDRQVAKVENILRKNGTEMLKVAQFSNGEAMYQIKKKI